MSTRDKRKNNIIQGGWSKGNKKKTAQINIPVNSAVGFTPVFDAEGGKNIAKELKSNFRPIEIKSDCRKNLNDVVPDFGEYDPAIVQLINGFLTLEEVKNLTEYFMEYLPWEQRENATAEGVAFKEPRETCWYGLPYAYSAVELAANNEWDHKLLELRKRLENYAKEDEPFNSVFCNLYRTEKNSIAWHADDEKSLGQQPTIASISLGATRVFELCRRDELFGSDFKSKVVNGYRSRNKDEPPFDDCTDLYRVFLEPGSLLIMSGSVQQHWLHRVPKEYHGREPRINFTFRHIVNKN